MAGGSIFPSLTGLMGGFNEAHDQYRDEQLRIEQERSQREAGVFNALLSSPDPEIQAMAATGMITGAMGPQRKSGIRGWIGDVQSNPILPKIRDYIQAHGQASTPSALPSRSITGIVPSEPGTAGQVSTQTTRAGQPAPTATSPDQAKPWTDVPATVGQPPPTAGTPAESTGPAPIQGLKIGPVSTPPPVSPPHIFPSPEDLSAQKYRGEYAGEIQGITQALIQSGLSPQEAAATARDHFLRSRGVGAAGALQLVHGKGPDGQPADAMFDKRPGSPTQGSYLKIGSEEPFEGFVGGSIQQPRSTDREGMARELFGKPFSNLTADEAKQVNDRLLTFHGEMSGAQTTGRAGALSTAPLSTSERMHATEAAGTQWATMTAPVREMQRNLLVMQAALNNYATDANGSAQAMLKSFETILDPRATGVRASDFGLTKAGQDLFDRAQALYQRMIAGGGQGVTRENLTGLLSTAQAIVKSMQDFNEPQKQRITQMLQDYGIDPADALGADYVPTPGTGKAPGTVGTPPPVGPAAAPGGGGPTAYQDPKTGEWHIR